MLTWKVKVALLFLGGVLVYLFYLGMFNLHPYRFQLSKLNQEVWADYDHAENRAWMKYRQERRRATKREEPERALEYLLGNK